jgi:quinoprotein glucose dehydrogenase
MSLRSLVIVCLVSLILQSSAAPVSAQSQPAFAGSLKFSKWSGDLNVPDPVAISFDHQGRAYITQTQRRKANDLDIRANRDWVINDQSFQSVSDKLQFYHQQLGPGVDQARNQQRVKDLNGDGSSDYRDLMVLSERILQMQDSDQDGVADSIHVFAEGFQTEVTGIAAGVLAHDGDVYTTIAPDVWVLRDSDQDGKADQRRLLAHGFGLHIAYAGHDMHGLTVGPDGKIYWSIGDKGISVTDAAGRRWHYPHEGGVMRCNPDGTNFEVFAHGLRNVQELAFDQYGNLFGVDNDADQPLEKERFVYIVRGMDAGWRCFYQYRGDDWNPWTDEGLWQTHFPGQAGWIIPPISHSINGPAGFAFNPGTALSPDYADYFFLTGAPNGQQIAFQVQPDGASFQMTNQHEIGNGIPLVGINFGPDGALYGVDWGGGYPLNQTGAVWSIDDPEFAESAQRREVRELLAQDFEDFTDAQLGELLRHPDQRVRLSAQFELVRGNVLHELSGAARDPSEPLLARIHAVWGLGQLAYDDPDVVDSLELLLTDTDPDLVLQVVRTIGDLPSFDGNKLLPLLKHSDDRLRLQVMLALQRHQTPTAFEPLIASATQLHESKTYLRHAVSYALSTCGAADQLAELKTHRDSMVRLVSVIALRHQGASEAAVFLDDEAPVVRHAAARAIHDDWSIPMALPALAETLADSVVADAVMTRRAINAGFRMGRPEDALRIARFAGREDADLELRREALDALAEWRSPYPLDRVTGQFRELPATSRAFDEFQLKPILATLVRSERKILQADAMRVMRSLKIQVDDTLLAAIVRSEFSAPQLVVESLEALATQQSPLLPESLLLAARFPHAKVVSRGLELAVEHDIRDAVALVTSAASAENPILVRQTAIRLLPDLNASAADDCLVREFQNVSGRLSESPVALELIEAMQRRSSESRMVAEVYDGVQRQLTVAPADSPEQAYLMCMSGGDVEVGRRLFNTHLQAQCVRCHRVGRQGSTVGPRLDGIALKRKPDYLLRSIVAPGSDIEEAYRSQVVVMDSGLTVLGVKVRETDASLVLADQQGREVELSKSEIEDRLEQNVSIMPDMRQVLSRSEIRDLLAYLISLDEPAER